MKDIPISYVALLTFGICVLVIGLLAITDEPLGTFNIYQNSRIIHTKKYYTAGQLAVGFGGLFGGILIVIVATILIEKEIRKMKTKPQG